MTDKYLSLDEIQQGKEVCKQACDNAAFIAHAREAYPKALDSCEEAYDAITAAVDVIYQFIIDSIHGRLAPAKAEELSAQTQTLLQRPVVKEAFARRMVENAAK